MIRRLPYILTGLVLFAVILAASSTVVPTAYAQTTTADFRIIDISEHQGQLLVQVEHFKTNGTFDYFENYMWQGREGLKFPRITNSDGIPLMDNGQPVPYVVGLYGRTTYQLPANRNWKLSAKPYLTLDSIIGVVQDIHDQRLGWVNEDWPGGKKRGQNRLIEPDLNPTINDSLGIDKLLPQFTQHANQGFKKSRNGRPTQFFGQLPDVHTGNGKREYGTVYTFYPDASSVDGSVFNQPGSQVWSTQHDAASGTGVTTTAAVMQPLIATTTTTNQWNGFYRAFTLYDTQTLTSSAIITSATSDFVSDLVSDNFGGSLSLVTTSPASDTTLVVADFDQYGTAVQAPDMAISAINADSATYNLFSLNSTGLSNISKTGITKFGYMISADRADSEPSWASDVLDRVSIATSEETLPGDKRPRLVVTATVPSAAITGTIGDGATEQEVRDGGGTILVTLTDETWVAAGATFNAQRQAIIDGLDAASSPTTGWNNEVRDSIGVASVVRTSATLATITLTASEVAGYAIASNEIITMTVPAAALTGGVALTATPTITITAAVESAAITGTIGDGATEQEVRDGGGTILVTLTNTAWVAAAGSVFDNQRQNIIDGLVAADSQTYGWNNEVKAKLGVTAVVRTSDTLVTITIPAGDVEDYRIVTNEVITTTVPASAMVFASALVATPTTTITGTVESAAVSGTLGGSGGTAAEIEAGGETVIITLTNTTWVTAGATFNAQRQNILDGLVADDSDVNGWNAMAFAVGDVVRTSGTIVTITLSAESAYAIPSAETVTTTVPASAIVYGAALVAPETFTISPAAFATSGNRVSTAINLSGVTDLAYCAIGWETTLPTNTTVAIETSVDGGVTYSTATNGNCPTGLTLGESLSSITDFRVKATLTTTDTSATPLITALGLILEDAGGSELCYQLLTTPSASLADNCGTYTGTMSFPIGPSTITSSTAPITSTADPLPNARSLAGQDVAQAVTGSATSARLFPAAGDEGGFVGLPLNDLVNEMSTVGDGLPVRFVWFIFLGIATIGAGMLAVHLTSNLFIAAGAMAAVMGFQMAIGSTGLLPGWILFAFIPLAAAFLLFRRGFPV
jgi:hypothetical protein